MPNQLTLGIAKIGDILLQNRITQVEDGEEITDILLKIPEYQRPCSKSFSVKCFIKEAYSYFYKTEE